jgi:[ribosomal protein S18]-alanine N-acetyltransferase
MSASSANSVQLLPMTRDHLDLVLPHEAEMFGAEAWSRQSYREELADTRHRYYVVAIDEVGALLGWAGVRVVGGEADILTVGVVPAARRRGTGTRLVHALLDEARRRGATAAFLEVRVDNPTAQALYEREGFRRVGVRRGYYDGGRVDAVTMRRDV